MDYTLLSCIDSRVESPMKFYGRFELGPFAPGQGLRLQIVYVVLYCHN
jgi:hypothetical protein